LLALIPQRHFAPGRRLDRIVSYNSAGRAIASLAIRTTTMGVYPCTRRNRLGYGVSECS
jgi:hypothetical protein